MCREKRDPSSTIGEKAVFDGLTESCLSSESHQQQKRDHIGKKNFPKSQDLQPESTSALDDEKREGFPPCQKKKKGRS